MSQSGHIARRTSDKGRPTGLKLDERAYPPPRIHKGAAWAVCLRPHGRLSKGCPKVELGNDVLE